MRKNLESKTILLVTGALVLTAAILFSKEATALDDFDLYKYGDTKVVIERTSLILKIVPYTTQRSLDDAYLKSTGKKDAGIAGIRAFTNTAKGNDVCTVHMIMPKIWDDRESLAILGHEVLHCTFADHQDADQEILDRKEVWNTPQENNVEKLYEEDRLLELEWLREDYMGMGIIIDESP
jgi:hypothetical protein